MKATNSGQSTQTFFSAVTNGNNETFKPFKNFEYDLDSYSNRQKDFIAEFEKFKGNFDEHIATSIPGYREDLIVKGSAIVRIAEKSKEGIVLFDLGGSEGSFIKSICSLSTNIKAFNIEPNKDMVKTFNATPVAGAEIVEEAFFSGWDNVKAFMPAIKADIVHESMLFQFLDNKGSREAYYDHIIKDLLKEEGVFITRQKFRNENPKIYIENEAIKDEFKLQYYTQDQLNAKTDEVLVGMSENQAYLDEHLELLKSKFKYVRETYKQGNFVGYSCTNSEETLNNY